MSINPKYCAAFLTDTGCGLGRNCKQRHDILECLCGYVLPISDLQVHMKGRMHTKMLLRQADKHLGTSQIAKPGPVLSVSHFMHVRFSVHSLFQKPVAPHNTAVNFERCPACNKSIPSTKIIDHIEEHARQERVRVIRESLERALQDKDSITVSATDGIDFGVIEADSADGIAVIMTNITPGSRIALETYQLSSAVQNNALGARYEQPCF